MVKKYPRDHKFIVMGKAVGKMENFYWSLQQWDKY